MHRLFEVTLEIRRRIGHGAMAGTASSGLIVYSKELRRWMTPPRFPQSSVGSKSSSRFPVLWNL